MKKLFLLLAMVGMLAIACSTPGGGIDDDNNSDTTDKIVVKPATIEVAAEANDYVVAVSSPCLWLATTENEWITIETERGGDGEQELIFSVADWRKTEPREGKVVVSNDDKGLSTELIITQAPSPYSIGALVTKNGVTGIVFYNDDTVTKIVSVETTSLKWSTEYASTGATDWDNGANNMATIKSISGWEGKYPAFKWCSDCGEGWYLPAYNELREIYNNRTVIDATLEANGYTTLGTKWYWSSTESDSYDAYLLGFNSGSRNSSGKFPANNVCAILAF